MREAVNENRESERTTDAQTLVLLFHGSIRQTFENQIIYEGNRINKSFFFFYF